MKKLLTSAAVCGLMVAVAPAAHADIDLELGGYFKGYGVFMDQDDNADTDGTTAGVQGAGEAKGFDFIRETEIHIGGETTLDNGLTVGFHLESDADRADSDLSVDESYLYFSGAWGRVNFGDEDGAGYLLQVAAPSADSNIDGIRQYVQPVNYTAAIADIDADGAVADDRTTLGIIGSSIDYDMDPSSKTTKLTYLSPILNGFQLGLSYAPDTDNAAGLGGVGTDDQEDTIEETYEIAARYEGIFNNVGVIAGAGYSHGENGAETSTPAVSDDRETWNAGIDLDIGPFGIGAIYMEDNGALESSTSADDEETIVVGVDYTTGPFKLGASYFDQENTFAVKNFDTQRYSGGVTYTYGPGMTFRGSIGYVEHDGAALGTSEIEATYVTVGTQVNF